MAGLGGVMRAKDAALAWYGRQRAAHPSLRHTVQAYQRAQANNGNQYAAAITFFSFLALFPLLLLAVAVTGFVLSSHPALQTSLLNDITSNIPGQVGETLKSSISGAIEARGSVGAVGLIGVLLTGLGWIGNLRDAMDAVWGRTPPKHNFVMSKVVNLGVLAGLGLGALLSVALTVVGTSVTSQLASALGLENVFGAVWLLKVLGIAVAVAGDWVIFWWVLVRLSGVSMPREIGVRGALLAAVGFELLKILGSYTIAKSAKSPTAGPFAGILAVLIWVQLVARWLLFCTAWTAVLTEERQAAQAPTDFDEEVASSEPPPEPLSPAAVGAALVGTGAAVGAAATVVLLKRPGRRSS